MTAIEILDWIIGERGLTYGMITSFCGNTRQHWHKVHRGHYNSHTESLLNLKQIIESNNLLGVSQINKLLTEKGASMSSDSKDKKVKKVKKKPVVKEEFGGRGKERKPPPP